MDQGAARLDAAGYCPPGEEHRASVARRGKPHRRQTRQGKIGLAAGDPFLSSRAVAHSRGGEASGRPEERERWIAMSEQASAHTINDLDEIEQMAVELATLAGAEIVTTFGGIFTVRYMTGDAGKLSMRDPVSEVDRRVETLIRTRLAERFPTHDIIAEEMEERPSVGQECVWAVDPIDGTTNFVNGFPMFAASIGMLHRGSAILGPG